MKSMDTRKFITRFFPSLTDFAFLAPLVLLFTLMDGTRTLLSDGDTGWHIRAGDWILANGRIPTTDFFSFTQSGKPWFAFEWLWDVLFALLHRQGGMAAVLAVSVCLICLTFALLYRVVRSRCENDFLAFAVTLLAVAGSSLHFVARPHVFTLLFIVVLCAILERVRTAGPKLLLAVPVLMLLWVNLHPGFVAGIVVVAAYACGDLAAFLVAPQGAEAKPALARSGYYGLAAAACVPAALANPYGYHLLAHIWTFLSNPFLLTNISEYQAVDFRAPAGRCFEAMLILGAVAAFMRMRRREFTEVFLFAVWAHLALTSQRHVPIFMILMAPPVAFALHEMLSSVANAPVADWIRRAAAAFEHNAREFAANDRIERFHILSVAALVLLFLLIRLPGAPPKFRAEYSKETYPDQALAAFTALSPSARVFTTDVWGGYLIYRLYPEVRIFVDGRIDFYGSAFGQEVLDALAGRDTWRTTFQRYGVNAALIPVDVPLTVILRESREWEPVYGDSEVAVFRRLAKN
jgi:hypothetical protein